MPEAFKNRWHKRRQTFLNGSRITGQIKDKGSSTGSGQCP